MRTRLVVAFVVVLGVAGQRAQDSRLSADQTDPTLVGAAHCLQDFPTAASRDARATVVMCGLDNPRGLAFGQHALYVAEAGRGGLGRSTPECFIGMAAGATRCYGPNGAISRLWNGTQERVATGLPSHANLMGRQAIGPHDITLVGGADVTNGLLQRPPSDDCHPGCAYVTIGLQQPPNYREAPTHSFLKKFAQLIQVLPTGEPRTVADLGDYEATEDPDHVFYAPPKLDTNPYGLVAAPGGRGFLVVDSGGNSLLEIDAHGTTSTYAVFAPHPEGTRNDSVPTAVERGPDGAYYVGELTGFPLVPNAANIYRLGGSGESPEVCLTGFTQIIDLTFDKHGTLYVLQYGGFLHRVIPDKRAAFGDDRPRGMCAHDGAGDQETLVSGLTNPTSVAVGPDGAVYISNRGAFPITGQVIRFELQAK